MKYKIVLVPFPFDDLTASKVRPAVCLTDEIKPYNHPVDDGGKVDYSARVRRPIIITTAGG